MAVVTATKDRPDQLRRLLSNLRDQSFTPEQIIVVDGSDNPVASVIDEFPELNVDYVTVRPPGLTRQKNAGVAAVRQDIDLVAILDDDIMLHDGAMDTMMGHWDTSPADLGGASFDMPDFIYGPHVWTKTALKRLFFVNDEEFGQVLSSGFSTPLWNITNTTSCRWLGGGYTVWRKEVFDQFKFIEWYPGSGVFEDVHFSHQVNKKYKLAMVAGAHCTHVDPPAPVRAQRKLGERQIINWVYFVNNNPDLSLARCLWACVGRMVLNFTKGVLSRQPTLVMRSFGNLQGLLAVSTGAARNKPALSEEQS